jgi:hypothetical protein
LVVSVEELKKALSSLSVGEQSEISVFLVHLRQLPSASVQEVEHADWGALSARGLARGYSDSEPEYTEADIKQR